MKIKIGQQAKNDLILAHHFYERQIAGLGRKCLDSLYADIDTLYSNAGIHRIFFGQYYRLLSNRFPFAIYYHCSNDTVYIDAVLDCRQSPQKIFKRFS